jgi:hypothetical protein
MNIREKRGKRRFSNTRDPWDNFSVLGMQKTEDLGLKSMVFRLQSQTVTTGMLN